MPIEDTGWRKPDLSIQDGLPTGTIQTATGMEQRPCFMCRSFEKDNKRLLQHLNAKGLKPNAEGCYETPIVQDFQGRRSMKIDPRNFGYCRKGNYVTDMRASCADFQLVTTRSELQSKIR